MSCGDPSHEDMVPEADVAALLEEQEAESAEALKRVKDDLRAAQTRVAELEGELNAEKDRAQTLETSNVDLQGQVGEYRRKLRAEAEKARSGGGGRRGKADRERTLELESEHQRLQAQLDEARDEVDRVNGELDERDELAREMASQIEQLRDAATEAEAARDEAQEELKALQEQVKDLEVEIAASGAAEDDLLQRQVQEQAKHRQEVAALNQQMDNLRGELVQQQQATRQLKDKTMVTELQAERDRLLVANAEHESALAQLAADLQEAVADRDEMTAEIEQHKEQFREKVDDAVSAERRKAVSLQRQLETTKQHLKSARAETQAVQNEKSEVQSTVQELETWKANYEEGHGMKELASRCKQLTNDVKRRERELGRARSKMSEIEQANEALELTARRLKEELGKPADFQYDDLRVRSNVQGETARLIAVNQTLEAQLADVQDRNVELMAQQRRQAAAIGEKGLKFDGLEPTQVKQVMDFAANLRAGEIELPLDDRSRELQQELRQQKAAYSALETEIVELRAARGLPATSGGAHGGGGGAAPEGLVADLREELVKLRQENASIMEALREQAARTPAGPAPAPAPAPAAAAPTPVKPKLSVDPPRTPRLSESAIGGMLDQLKRDLLESKSGTGADQQLTQQLMSLQAENDALRGQAAEVASLHEQIGRLQQQQQQQQQQQVHHHHHQTPAKTPVRDAYRGPNFTGTLGLRTPKSPGGHLMLQQQLSAMSLPPEEWADEVKALNGQLVECLEELCQREDECRTLEGTLAEYEAKLATIHDQHTMLYRQYAREREQADGAAQQLRAELRELREERDTFRVRAKRLDELCEMTAGDADEDDVRRHVRRLTRKVAVYEVNECVLARRYTLLENESKSLRERHNALNADMMEQEQVAKERILHLEAWKRGAAERIERLQTALDRSVPRDQFVVCQREHDQMRDSYLALLQRDAELRADFTRAQSLPRQLLKLRMELGDMHAALEAAQAGEAAARAELADHVAVVESQAQGQQLMSEIAKWRGEATRFQVEMVGARTRAEQLDRRVEELSEELERQVTRCNDLDARAFEARSMAERARDDARRVLAMYEGGATADEAAALRERVEWLEEEHSKLAIEADHQRELAELASAQTEALGSRRREQADELAALREHARTLESRTDDDTIIGKLQHQLLSMRATYAAFARKHELTRANLRHREVELRKLRERVDDKDALLQRTREASRVELQALRAALDEIRSDAAGVDATAGGDGVITMARVNALADGVRELAETSERQEAELAESEVKRRDIEGELAEVRLHKQTLEQENADLRTTAQSKVARRLMALTEEVKAAKLEALRQQRELAVLRDEKRHLQSQIATQEDQIQRLEEGAVEARVHPVGRGRGQRQQRRESELDGFADEPAPSKDFEVGDGFGDGFAGVGVGAGMYDDDAGEDGLLDPDTALDRLQQAESKIVSLMQELAEVRAGHRDAEARAEQADLTVAERDRAIQFMRRRLEAEGMATSVDLGQPAAGAAGAGSPMVPPSPSRTNRITAMYQVDQQRLQQAARATISTLKALVEEKSRMVEQLKGRLTDARRQFAMDREEDRAEIERLNSKLYADNKDAIADLRQAMREMERVPEGVMAGGNRDLLEQVEEAQKVLAERDRRIDELETLLSATVKQRDTAEARCGEALDEGEAMKADMEVLAAQLAAAHEALEADPGAGAEGHGHGGHGTADARVVRRLKAALAAKEKKLGQLREAVVKIKGQFLKAEETRELDLLKDRHEKRREVEEKEDEMEDVVRNLQGQLRHLRDRAEGMQRDVTEAQEKERDAKEATRRLQTELRRLRSEGAVTERHADEHSEDLRRYQRELEEARAREQRLREKLAESKESVGGQEEEEGGAGGGGGRVAQLEREVRVLRAQNDALRSAGPVDAGGGSPDERAEAKQGQQQQQARRGGRSGLSHAAWENEKRLKKRIETLTRRLDDKSAELATALAQATQAKDLLHRAQQERDGLAKRLHSTAAEDQSVRHATMAELDELQDVRDELAREQDKVAALERRLQVESRREAESLRTELAAANSRVHDQQREIDDLFQRLEGSGAGAGGLDDALRERLRDAQAATRRAEGELLERDNAAMELRFDCEAQRAELERLRKRVRDLEVYRSVASKKVRGVDAAAKQAMDGQRGAGQRFKRERDLEGVVDALKRVVEKLKSENERLKRGQARASAPPSARQAKRMQELERANAEMARRLEEAGAEDAERQSAQAKGLQDKVLQMRRQLRGKDAELKAALERLRDSEGRNEKLNEELQQASRRIKEVSRARASAMAGAGGHGGSAAARVRELEARVEEHETTIRNLRRAAAAGGGGGAGPADGELRAEVADLRAQIKEMAAENRSLRSRSATGLDAERLRQKVAELSAENEQQARELSAFDSQFFSEIEDLKYGYVQARKALKRCRCGAAEEAGPGVQAAWA